MTNPLDIRIPFIDIETTGLDPQKDHLLQVALIITDGAFNEISRHQWIVKYSKAEADKMRAEVDPYVRDMHDATKLWRQLPKKTSVSMEKLDGELYNVLRDLQGDRRIRKIGIDEPLRPIQIAGNSVRFDRDFLWTQLYTVSGLLSHRVLDISSVLGFFRATGNKVELPKAERTHDAMEDIEDCVNQARAILGKLESSH